MQAFFVVVGFRSLGRCFRYTARNAIGSCVDLALSRVAVDIHCVAIVNMFTIGVGYRDKIFRIFVRAFGNRIH
jgi:hypothetical protein